MFVQQVFKYFYDSLYIVRKKQNSLVRAYRFFGKTLFIFIVISPLSVSNEY